MPEMVLDRIRTSQVGDLGMILLRAKDDGSYLCIWTRAAEASAIQVKLQDVTLPRPMTHDLLPAIIGASGGTAHRVTISDIIGDTFYAKVVLHHGNSEAEVDARPSDAIALAVRSHVPIFVDETVLEKAGLEIASASGALEVTAEGHGFLRQVPLFGSIIDVYVSAKQVRHFGLNTGASLEGEAWRLRAGERGCWLSQVGKINGQVPGWPHPSQHEQLEIFRSRSHAVAVATHKINDKYGEFVITPALMMGMDETIIDRIAFGGVKELEELYQQ